MRKRHISWLIVLMSFATVLVTSCGGTGSSSGSSATHWQYTAMGDSLAVGVLANSGYVPRYSDDITSDTGVQVTRIDLGQNGAHSGDLLNSLKNDPNFRNSISSSQVVTWDIGGDDLLHAVGQFRSGTCGGADNQDCLRAAVATFMPNWDAIVQQILAMRSQSNTVIRTMDVYNPFVTELMVAGSFNTIEPYLDQVNAHIAASAAANNIPMAKVHEAFNGPNGDQDPITKGFIAIDGIHPNDNGHKAIADQLRALGYSPLK
jgi:lysophospholipase L1-like esterase